MSDLLRPSPPRSRRDRLVAVLGAVGPARLAAGTGTVVLVAATAWWLLRVPAPPVEARLPRAGAVTSVARSSRAGGSADTGRASPALPGSASPSTSPSAPQVVAAATAGAGPPATIVVQAEGAVVKPGVYRLPDGARVVDLVAAAGGPTADAETGALALAAKLVDGQRVVVPRPGETIAPPTSAAPAPSNLGARPQQPTPSAPLDLNAASVDDLDRLPGVGPATAAAIVAYRTKHGRFANIEELADVPGIGPAKLDALRDLVRV